MDGDAVKIENVVGTGNIEYTEEYRESFVEGNDDANKPVFEIDVEQLADGLGPETWSNDGPHPGLHMRMDEGNKEAPLTTFYRSGKYIIRASTPERLQEENEKVQEELDRIGVLYEDVEVNFKISNIVCVADMERDINLEALAIALDLEKVEYEPEQFPALIYRDPSQYACTFLVFANGNVVIPGGTNIKKVRSSFEEFSGTVEEWLI